MFVWVQHLCSLGLLTNLEMTARSDGSEPWASVRLRSRKVRMYHVQMCSQAAQLQTCARKHRFMNSLSISLTLALTRRYAHKFTRRP